MYTYFKGLIIREGTHGLNPTFLRDLFIDAEWLSKDLPEWQNEKFTIAFENSTWAFTVWDNEEMVGMVRVISDKVMYATIYDLVVKRTHRGKGIGKELVRLCLNKLPHGDWFAHTTPNNYNFYKKCGLEVEDIDRNGTCVLYGYRKAKEEGNR